MRGWTREPGVYAITHIPTGRRYIGSSTNPKARWRGHRAALRQGRHRNAALQADWSADGEEAFTFTILEEADDMSALRAIEERWFSQTPLLYNSVLAAWRAHFGPPVCRPLATSDIRALPLFEARFWARVDRTAHCWIWTGYKDVRGYGHVALRRQERRSRPELAHRVAYALAYGAVPPGAFVCHRCDQPSCVRPEHLFLGDNSANIQDMWVKGRGARLWARGESHGLAVLTTQQVLEIRARYAAGERCGELAAAFGVGVHRIDDIVTWKSWAHLGGTRVKTGHHGRHNGRAKLTEDQVREIRRRKAAGESQASLARAFGLGESAISSIVRREHWLHVD
jgi:hypothetical protein